MVVGRGEEELSFDEDWRGFEGGFVDEVGFDVEGAGAVCPGDFELPDVGFGDLRCGRETSAASVVTVAGPCGVGRFLSLGAGGERRTEKKGERDGR